jgi:hypothetical protein
MRICVTGGEGIHSNEVRIFSKFVLGEFLFLAGFGSSFTADTNQILPFILV